MHFLIFTVLLFIFWKKFVVSIVYRERPFGLLNYLHSLHDSFSSIYTLSYLLSKENCLFESMSSRFLVTFSSLVRQRGSKRKSYKQHIWQSIITFYFNSIIIPLLFYIIRVISAIYKNWTQRYFMISFTFHSTFLHFFIHFLPSLMYIFMFYFIIRVFIPKMSRDSKNIKLLEKINNIDKDCSEDEDTKGNNYDLVDND